MTIKVELSPEDEARLTREAEIRGVRPERYARDLLQAALIHGVHPKEDDDDPLLDHALDAETIVRMKVEEFPTMLHTLARGADSLPNLATESFTRESFYRDRDIAADA
jgi:hypothetical protein